MVKGERAVISCPAKYACNASMLPDPPGHPDRVEFELHLLHLAQVFSSVLCKNHEFGWPRTGPFYGPCATSIPA